MTTGKMEKKEFMSGFWRSCCLQGCFNYERQQGLGFGYAMIPHLRRIYKDDPEGFKEAMKRHLVFYNITPQCTTFVQGIAVAMEEEAASNPDFDASSINAIKTALMGPLSGIGDSIFWGVLRLLAASIAITFAASGSILAPISFLLIFNVPAFICRYYLTYKGFSLGTTFLSDMQKSGTIQILTKAASILGLVMIGAMVASTVTFKCALAIPVENADPITVQTYLDSIFKGLVPLSLTLGCLYAQMKKININIIMLLVLALAMILALLGVV